MLGGNYFLRERRGTVTGSPEKRWVPLSWRYLLKYWLCWQNNFILLATDRLTKFFPSTGCFCSLNRTKEEVDVLSAVDENEWLKAGKTLLKKR